MTHDDDSSPIQSPRKRSWGRLLVKIGVITFSLVVVLIVGLVAFLHTGMGQEVVRGIVEERLQERVNGDVELGELSFALLGDVAIRDLSITDESGTKAVGLGELELRLDWGTLLDDTIVITSVTVGDVSLDIRENEEGVSNLATLFKPSDEEKEPLAKTIRVAALSVSNLNVSLAKANGTVVAVKKLGLDAAIETNPKAQTLLLDVSKLALGVDAALPDGRTISLPTLELAAVVDKDGDDIVAELQGFSTEATVTLPDRAEPIVAPIAIETAKATIADGRVDATIENVELAAVTLASIVVDAQLPPKGEKPKLVGSQNIALSGLSIDAKKVNALLGKDVLAADVGVDLSIKGEPGALELAGTVQTGGGKLALSGTLDASDLKKPAYDIALAGTDLDTQKMLALATIPHLTSEMEVTIKGNGAKREDIVADLTLDISETRIRVDREDRNLDVPIQGIELEARADKGSFKITKLLIKAFDQELALLGGLGADNAINAELKTTADVAGAVAALRPTGLVPPDFKLPVGLETATVDLTVEAVPRTPTSPPIISKLLPAEIAAKIPMETASIKGTVQLEELDTGTMQMDDISADIDLSLSETGPFGTLNVAVSKLASAQLMLDTLDANIAIKDDALQVEIIGVNGKKTVVDVSAGVSLDEGSDELVLDLDRAEVTQGRIETRLLSPVTLRLPREITEDPIEVTIPRIRLALAGGSLAVSGRAKIHRDPPTVEAIAAAAEAGEPPVGELAVDDFNVSLDLDGVDIGRAAAMAGKSVPVSGTVGGTVYLSGTPDDPTARVNLDTRIRLRDRKSKDRERRVAERSIDVGIRANVRDGRLDLGVLAKEAGTPSSDPILDISATAPLHFKDGIKVASGGRLDAKVRIPKRRIGDLFAVVPRSLIPEGIDENGSVEALIELEGTPSRPRGTIALDLEGELIAFAKPEQWRGRRQRISLRGDIDSATKSPQIHADLDVWLDADKPKTVTLGADVALSRSPLVSRKPKVESWAVKLDVPPLDLQRIPPSDPAKPLPRGQVGLQAALNGTMRDVFGTVDIAATGIRIKELPPIDANLGIAIGESATVTGTVDFDGIRRLLIDGDVGVAGSGLLATLRAKKTHDLMDSPLALTLTVPEHEVSEWAELAPATEKLPGNLDAAIRVAGTIAEPTLDLAVTYDDFKTLDGSDGAVQISAIVDSERADAGVFLGAPRNAAIVPIKLGATLARADIESFIKKESNLLSLQLYGSSDGATLKRLAPAFAIDGDALDVDGKVALDLAGDVTLERLSEEEAETRGKAIDLAAIDFNARLAVTDAAVSIPGQDRRFEDINLIVSADPSAVNIETIEARERDLQTDERTVNISGRVDMHEFKPQNADLDIKVNRWLATGTFDAPEAALTADIGIQADLSKPGKDVHVVIRDIFFDATTRYPRGHYFRDLGEQDIVWMDEPGAPPVGKLPSPPSEEVTTVESDPTEKAISRDLEKGKAIGSKVIDARPDPVPTHTVVIDILDGKAIRDVLAVEPQGQVKVTIGPDGVDLDGTVTMQGGSLGFAGGVFELAEGSVKVGGPDVAWLDLTFALEPRNYTKRAISGTAPETTVQVLGPVVGNKLVIRGAGGPTLKTSFAAHIGQTPLHLSGPDLPATETVSTPHGEMPLIQSFMGTNLPHMLFLDHASAWSDPYDPAVNYGELHHGEYDMSLHDGSGRLRAQANPPDVVAGSTAEVHYDWIWGDTPSAIYGMGARLGDRASAGLELFVEWSSDE